MWGEGLCMKWLVLVKERSVVGELSVEELMVDNSEVVKVFTVVGSEELER